MDAMAIKEDEEREKNAKDIKNRLNKSSANNVALSQQIKAGFELLTKHAKPEDK